jgi:hypothetical protein
MRHQHLWLIILLCTPHSHVVHAEPGGWMNCRLNSGLFNYVSCDFVWTGIGIVLFGAFIVPSILLATVNGLACHPYRSRTKQILLGALMGLLSLIPLIFLLSVTKYFLHHYYPNSDSGNNTLMYPGILILVYYTVVGFLSYRYARSIP